MKFHRCLLLVPPSPAPRTWSPHTGAHVRGVCNYETATLPKGGLPSSKTGVQRRSSKTAERERDDEGAAGGGGFIYSSAADVSRL